MAHEVQRQRYPLFCVPSFFLTVLLRAGQLSQLHKLSGQARGIYDPLATSPFVLQLAIIDMNQSVYSATVMSPANAHSIRYLEVHHLHCTIPLTMMTICWQALPVQSILMDEHLPSFTASRPSAAVATISISSQRVMPLFWFWTVYSNGLSTRWAGPVYSTTYRVYVCKSAKAIV